jgi:hypothetical protein
MEHSGEMELYIQQGIISYVNPGRVNDNRAVAHPKPPEKVEEASSSEQVTEIEPIVLNESLDAVLVSAGSPITR